MPIDNVAYAAYSATEELKPYKWQTRDPVDTEVLIEVFYCGLCHSDIHTLRREWAAVPDTWPKVCGHEMVGVVCNVGPNATKHKVGDKVGVGCYVNTCKKCDRCADPLTTHYCDNSVFTYSSTDRDGTPTTGGYGRYVIADETCAVAVPDSLPFDRVAPLLCAGITMWSPLRHVNAARGNLKIGVVGLGGLGHMALQFAAHLNPTNEVYVFSRSPSKKDLAIQLGAKGMIISPEDYAKHASSFDYILDTVSANKNMTPYIDSLKLDGTLVIVGVPPSNDQPTIPVMNMILRRRSILGSTIGSYKEVEDMLQFCAEKNILPMTELVACEKVNECFDRVLKSDVKFRFVFDIKNTHA